MKDHEIAQLVNALRDCAVEFHAAQQLRERIAALVVPALRGRRSPDRQQDAARYLWLRDNADKWLGSPKVVCGPMGDQSFTAGAAMDRDIDAAIESAAALQQSSSGITAGAEKPSQVVDFGAAAQTRTGDLLITNQNEKAPETSQNQDVTPKLAPSQPAQVAPTESSGCEGVTATPGMWRMLSDLLDGHKLPESLNRAIHALCVGRAVVVPSTPTVAAMFGGES